MSQLLTSLQDSAPSIVALAATYLVHGLIALLLALMIEGALKIAVRELLWKLAILVPIAATLAVAVFPATWFAFGVEATWLPTSYAAVPQAPTLEAAASTPTALSSSARIAASDLATKLSWTTWVALALISVTGIGLIATLLQRLRLHAWLRSRVAITDPELAKRVQGLAKSLGFHSRVRVSAHSGLTTPIAFGTLRPEICLPPEALARLDRARGDAVLAHELAHLLGRDPLTFAGLSSLVRLCPWQPLLRIGKRRIEALAEYRCDAVAAGLTSRESVASCLVEVASWCVAGQRRPEFAGMATRASGLRARVERVLDADDAEVGARAKHRLRLPVLLLLLSTTTFAMPRFAPDSKLPLDVAIERSAIGGGARALLAALIELDAECTMLAHEFGRLQQRLTTVPLDARSLAVLTELGAGLNALDRRRIAARERILEALAEELRLAPSSR